MQSYEDWLNTPVEKALHTETPEEYKARKAQYCSQIASKYHGAIVGTCIKVWEDYQSSRIYAIVEYHNDGLDLSSTATIECYLAFNTITEVMQAITSIYVDRILVIDPETHSILAAYAPLY